MTEESDKYNLDKEIRHGTQKYYIMKILEECQGEYISKRELEREFSFRWAFREINDDEKLTKFEFIKKACNIPGDVQKRIRDTYKEMKKYGMECIGDRETLKYRWNPIKREQLEDIIHPCARNLLKTDKEIKDFYKLKKNKCEMCGASKTDEQTRRMAIDHFRAHSKYNIDNKCIGVLLCEKCNNIHHNYDACKIALTYKDNLKIVKNWVKKEKEMRDKGFLPNEEDLALQKKVISEIIEYYQDINPINNEFWEGLN